MSIIKEYLHYLDKCLTPYHVRRETIKILQKEGFVQISPEDIPNTGRGKYYICAGNTPIIPIIIPSNPSKINLAATHSDSPVLKLKPDFLDKSDNMSIVRLRPYGGGLWHTWFDRPLNVAGVVILGNGRKVLVDSLFDVVIPSLPPHLNNGKVYKDGFLFDKEKTLNGLAMVEQEMGEMVFSGEAVDDKESVGPEIDQKRRRPGHADRENVGSEISLKIEGLGLAGREDVGLGQKVGELGLGNEVRKNENFEEVKFKLSDIIAHNLSLYDTSRAQLLNSQIIMSSRQDNLLSTFAALKALNAEGRSIKMLAIFDFEETGSMQLDGARSTFLKDVYLALKKKVQGGGSDQHDLILSLDVAHAYNFNYGEFYEKKHHVQFNHGIVIKHSPAYATDVDGTAYIKRKYKCQEFCLRNDCRGGGTIGTMLSTLLNTRCVDLGTPVLSMHSLKESSYCGDVEDTYKMLYEFYKK